jgi:hypothetical protein
VPVAALDPLSELALLPFSEPAAIGAACGVLETGRSTAVPVLVTPGWVTPVPAEFTCGALGFAPLWAKALEVKATTAVVAAMINIFFIIAFPRFLYAPKQYEFHEPIDVPVIERTVWSEQSTGGRFA